MGSRGASRPYAANASRAAATSFSWLRRASARRGRMGASAAVDNRGAVPVFSSPELTGDMSPFCEEPSTVTDQTTVSPTRTLDLVHDAYNSGDMDLAASLVAPDAVDHGAGDGTVPGSPEHVR